MARRLTKAIQRSPVKATHHYTRQNTYFMTRSERKGLADLLRKHRKSETIRQGIRKTITRNRRLK